MSDLPNWEQQLHRDLAEIQSSAAELNRAVTAVRGRGEVPGVNIEVDTTGEITSLQIAPTAMRWTSTQLTQALLDCHRRARVDAKTRVEKLVRKADPRLRTSLDELQTTTGSPESSPRSPQTEEEIQAADDEFFQRMNERGWR